jgi:uncharacterized membrane protein (TIGR02234 family)
MTARRSPLAAVLGCIVSGALVLLASGRRWAHTSVAQAKGQAPTALTATGHAVAPSLPALGIALLALSLAILASRGLLRRVVGIVVVVLAAAALAVAVSARGDVDAALEHREVGVQGLAVHATANGWWLVAAVGAAIGVLAGALTVLRSRGWTAMGAKYDAPSAQRPVRDPAAATWDALDRGEDPTA